MLNMYFLRDGMEGMLAEPGTRTALSRALRRANDEHGIDALLGFEMEAALLDKTNLALIPNMHAWSTSWALQNKRLDVLERIVDAFEKPGIEVLLFHAERAALIWDCHLPLPTLQAAESTRDRNHPRETTSAKPSFASAPTTISAPLSTQTPF